MIILPRTYATVPEYSFTCGHEKAPLHPSERSEASHLYTFKQNEFLYYLRASAM